MTCRAAHVRVTTPGGEIIEPRQAGCTCPPGRCSPSSAHQARVRVERADGVTLTDLAPPLNPGHMGRMLDGDDPPVAWVI